MSIQTSSEPGPAGAENAGHFHQLALTETLSVCDRMVGGVLQPVIVFTSGRSARSSVVGPKNRHFTL